MLSPRSGPRWLDRAVESSNSPRVRTIHAFCGDLLHERPLERWSGPARAGFLDSLLLLILLMTNNLKIGRAREHPHH